MKNSIIVILGSMVLILSSVLLYRISPPMGGTAKVDTATMHRLDKTPNPDGEESFFAVLDSNDVVIQVLAITEENVLTGQWGNPNNFVRTSNKKSIRKNFAGVGYTYDRVKDRFVAPKPTATAVLDEAKAEWSDPLDVKCIPNKITPCP